MLNNYSLDELVTYFDFTLDEIEFILASQATDYSKQMELF